MRKVSGVCAYFFTKNPIQYLHEKGKGKKLKSGSPEKSIFEKRDQRNG